MNDKIKEQLSAMVDGELPGNEQEFLLRRLEHDRDLQTSWSRYHLIGDAMRRHTPSSVDHDLAARVSSALGQDVHEQDIPLAGRQGVQLLKPVAGLAIAASVAVMAIVGMQNFTSTPTMQNAVPSLAQHETVPDIVRVRGTRWDLSQPGIESKLNGYLVNHNEYANETNLQGILHYARIAGYDSGK